RAARRHWTSKSHSLCGNYIFGRRPVKRRQEKNAPRNRATAEPVSDPAESGKLLALRWMGIERYASPARWAAHRPGTKSGPENLFERRGRGGGRRRVGGGQRTP